MRVSDRSAQSNVRSEAYETEATVAASRDRVGGGNRPSFDAFEFALAAFTADEEEWKKRAEALEHHLEKAIGFWKML
jgi:hypothetical protein